MAASPAKVDLSGARQAGPGRSEGGSSSGTVRGWVLAQCLDEQFRGLWRRGGQGGARFVPPRHGLWRCAPGGERVRCEVASGRVEQWNVEPAVGACQDGLLGRSGVMPRSSCQERRAALDWGGSNRRRSSSSKHCSGAGDGPSVRLGVAEWVNTHTVTYNGQVVVRRWRPRCAAQGVCWLHDTRATKGNGRQVATDARW